MHCTRTHKFFLSISIRVTIAFYLQNYLQTDTCLQLKKITSQYCYWWLVTQALEFRTPIFPHLVPPAIMVWIFVWKYIFEPFIHILQHFVLQLSRSTNFCFYVQLPYHLCIQHSNFGPPFFLIWSLPRLWYGSLYGSISLNHLSIFYNISCYNSLVLLTFVSRSSCRITYTIRQLDLETKVSRFLH